MCIVRTVLRFEERLEERDKLGRRMDGGIFHISFVQGYLTFVTKMVHTYACRARLDGPFCACRWHVLHGVARICRGTILFGGMYAISYGLRMRHPWSSSVTRVCLLALVLLALGYFAEGGAYNCFNANKVVEKEDAAKSFSENELCERIVDDIGEVKGGANAFFEKCQATLGKICNHQCMSLANLFDRMDYAVNPPTSSKGGTGYVFNAQDCVNCLVEGDCYQTPKIGTSVPRFVVSEPAGEPIFLPDNPGLHLQLMELGEGSQANVQTALVEENRRLLEENRALFHSLLSMPAKKQTPARLRTKRRRRVARPKCEKDGWCIEERRKDVRVPCEQTKFFQMCLSNCSDAFITCTKTVTAITDALPAFTTARSARRQIMDHLDNPRARKVDETPDKSLDSKAFKIGNHPGSIAQSRKQNNLYSLEKRNGVRKGAKKEANEEAKKEAKKTEDTKKTLNAMFSASLKPNGGGTMANLMLSQVSKGAAP